MIPSTSQTPRTPHPRQPVLFLPHGGGPCFFMDWPETWDRMAAFLRGVSQTVPQKPDAILVVSGHWETTHPTVTSAAHPPLIYDYYGFPPHTYHLRYPVPGSPVLAAQVQTLLTNAGIPNAADSERGLDHGVFIPFMLAFENADIPVVELSLQRDLDPDAHLRIGQALAPLRDQNVLIVGTGLTYHNLQYFMGESPESNAVSSAFDTWLAAAVCAPEAERNTALRHWESAPGARICHPRADHLLPLMVAAGAAGADRGTRIYQDTVMGKALSGFQFG
ncbi:class III extradiol ring-cleavage dioxygenase [Acetobacter farinalis]|uniref:Class III extradiol ring-cleavage dioxygenase n=1 Tax=Acetobacter farinalis TaxID=1260984 RepID=A0ABT3Q8Y0_9PROT|nr:class III extradiol ring-cleavage dioxygenase [Acetobacter farinalis]MCX2561753.1 class III extradiol ring-cleavage dioxygenase [Acetobacter farinalis]NHO30226.1 dioxygenase [Acetobacter farinalis]